VGKVLMNHWKSISPSVERRHATYHPYSWTRPTGVLACNRCC